MVFIFTQNSFEVGQATVPVTPQPIMQPTPKSLPGPPSPYSPIRHQDNQTTTGEPAP
jgi:hypothetical protein